MKLLNDKKPSITSSDKYWKQYVQSVNEASKPKRKVKMKVK